jgi:NAD(P)-dependent dehydrogenase (short-subunit alcohol dehydrogenase family)
MEQGSGNEQPRVALVTAAGGAIGRATVAALLAQGYRVIAADLDRRALDELAANAIPTALDTIVGDMTDRADVDRVFDRVRQIGALHVLINGVGSSCSGSLRDLTPDRWQRMFDLNLTSVLLCTQAAIPGLQASIGDRVIVNISSTLATVADPTTLAYGAFKAALEQWTRSLALDLAPQIRVVTVAPGPVADTAGEAAFDAATYAPLNPLRRFATGSEVAALIAFVASPAAAYLTGTTLRLDGGDSALGAGWGPLRALLETQPNNPA